jgi:hypothetical protein
MRTDGKFFQSRFKKIASLLHDYRSPCRRANRLTLVTSLYDSEHGRKTAPSRVARNICALQQTRGAALPNGTPKAAPTRNGQSRHQVRSICGRAPAKAPVDAVTRPFDQHLTSRPEAAPERPSRRCSIAHSATGCFRALSTCGRRNGSFSSQFYNLKSKQHSGGPPWASHRRWHMRWARWPLLSL